MPFVLIVRHRRSEIKPIVSIASKQKEWLSIAICSSVKIQVHTTLAPLTTSEQSSPVGGWYWNSSIGTFVDCAFSVKVTNCHYARFSRDNRIGIRCWRNINGHRTTMIRLGTSSPTSSPTSNNELIIITVMMLSLMIEPMANTSDVCKSGV